MKKPVYIRCPRCELNYIQKKDKYCSVCKAEMEAKRGNEEDEELELCPICKTNYIQPDEIMCASCLKEHRSEDDSDLGNDWEDYLVRDDEEDNMSMYEEMGEMASVDDLTKGNYDDDDIDTEISFEEDDDIQFDEEDFDEENGDDADDEEDFDEDDDDFDDDDFDDDLDDDDEDDDDEDNDDDDDE